jgi:hypothetical protein
MQLKLTGQSVERIERIGLRTLCLDAVVVVHAAGVERVARRLAGAAAVEDAAVLAVPQERRRCAHGSRVGSGRRATRDYEEKITEGLAVRTGAVVGLARAAARLLLVLRRGQIKLRGHN